MDAKYMELVTQFPLLPIASKAEHAAAKKVILELTKRDAELSRGEVGYGKVLVQLIQAYERDQIADFFETVSGNDALMYLLEQHGMKQTEAAEIAGVSKQNLNDFLKGRRGLVREARLRLANHFKVNGSVFELIRELTSA